METLRIDGYIGRDENYFSLKVLDTFLATLPKDTKEFTVEINSGGGSVIEGFAIYDRLRSLPFTLFTDIIGQCSSIATIISLAAKKENRSMSPSADYGIHFPYWEPERPEPFEAQDLINLGEELMQAQKKVLALYVKETGQPETVLTDLMENSRVLTAKEAKDLGFISTITSSVVNMQRYRIAAFIDPKKKTSDMDFTPKQKTVLEQMFNSLTEKFNKMFKPVFNAMLMELENGGKIFIDTEDAELKGKKVFTVDDAGNKTGDPAPDGAYILKDGRTVTVAGGMVTEVKDKEVPENETEALRKQVADLTAQLATANTKAEKTETEKATMETVVTAMKKEVAEFKNMVLGGDIPPAGQDFKGDPTSNLKSEHQEWLKYKKSLKEKAVKN